MPPFFMHNILSTTGVIDVYIQYSIHAMNLALLLKVGRGMENKYFFAQNVSERKLCVVNKAHFAPKKSIGGPRIALIWGN